MVWVLGDDADGEKADHIGDHDGRRRAGDQETDAGAGQQQNDLWLVALQEGQTAPVLQHELVFGLGPAGTGKTYLAVAVAVIQAQYLRRFDRGMQRVDQAAALDAVAQLRREDARALAAFAQFRRQHRFDLQQRGAVRAIGCGVGDGVGVGFTETIGVGVGAGPRSTSPGTSFSPTAIVIADFAREVATNE